MYPPGQNDTDVVDTTLLWNNHIIVPVHSSQPENDGEQSYLFTVELLLPLSYSIAIGVIHITSGFFTTATTVGGITVELILWYLWVVANGVITTVELVPLGYCGAVITVVQLLQCYYGGVITIVLKPFQTKKRAKNKIALPYLYLFFLFFFVYADFRCLKWPHFTVELFLSLIGFELRVAVRRVIEKLR